jgi:hypothetical protein
MSKGKTNKQEVNIGTKRTEPANVQETQTKSRKSNQ